jgi:hypothetical protein
MLDIMLSFIEVLSSGIIPPSEKSLTFSQLAAMLSGVRLLTSKPNPFERFHLCLAMNPAPTSKSDPELGYDS